MEYLLDAKSKMLISLNVFLVLGVSGAGAFNVFFVQVDEKGVMQKMAMLLLITLLFFLPNILTLRFLKTNRGRKATIIALAVWAIFCVIGLVSVKQTAFVTVICSLLIFVNTVSLIGVSASKQSDEALYS
ncbi:hypothetical protein ACJO2E_12925 [Marinobacter sp. M1N3S26]|uniref:hypothetical protein n=1 Tax=Marinobacter sp. M1N3S26 TaxID=3382299 RepID=UPI00387AE244